MDASELGELRVVPLHPHTPLQISRIAFCPTHDAVLAGTEEGNLTVADAPSGVRYSSVRGHTQPVVDVMPLSAIRDGAALSVSANSLACHTLGGRLMFRLKSVQGEAYTCCGIDTLANSPTGIAGHFSGRISSVDLNQGRLKSMVGPVSEGLTMIKGGDPHGYTALGTVSGSVCLADSRQDFKVQSLLSAHAGGLVDIDLAGGLLATCGLGTRQGQLVSDTIVKVYDLRATAKVMTTVVFSPGPSFLKFHPRYTDVLYVGSKDGNFTSSKLRGSQYNAPQQLQTGGSSVTGMDISPSGECMAFGTNAGYIHFLAFNNEPRILAGGLKPLERPPPLQKKLQLREGDPFGSLLPYYPLEGRLLSDWTSKQPGKHVLPPRSIDPALLANGKQVDFVTHVRNPYKRLPKPEAQRKIMAVRHQRITPDDGTRARELAEKKLSARRSSLLPYQYRRLHITVDQERKFQDFNFSKHNKTRFAGLENGIANCYANPLVQVLYFIPQIRAYLLQSVPDPSKEFSLLDELTLLFRMLATEFGNACQATNFLRALRQSREAMGLGLLEGHAVRGAPGTDIEVEAMKEKNLSRRVQNLQRFLLDKLHSEISLQSQFGSDKEAMSGEEKPRTKIDDVFGMKLQQNVESLQKSKAKISKEVFAFQVDLRYTSSSASPSKSAPKPAASPVSTGEKRPFSDVLRSSLKAEDETRAWFNDDLQYQHVKRTRHPLTLPQVLAVGTSMHDPASKSHWKVDSAATSQRSDSRNSWAPHVIAIDRDEDNFSIVQADRLQNLPPCSKESHTRTVYNLTAAVALVHEEEPFGVHTGPGAPEEGHLVAHVRVPISYLDANMSCNPTPRAGPDSPGYTPLNRNRCLRPASAFPPQPASTLSRPNLALSLPEDPFQIGSPKAAAQAATNEAPSQASGRSGASPREAQPEPSLPDDPFGEALSPSVASHVINSAGAAGITALSPELSETDEENQASLLGFSETEESGTELDDVGHAITSPDSAQAHSLPQQFSNLTINPQRSASLRRPSDPTQPTWLLINDFGISMTPQEEVLDVFGGHKLPSLLYYTKVDTMEKESKQEFKINPAAVLSSESFHALCKQPPLQSTFSNVVIPKDRNHKPSFVPLEPSEGPKAGQILALDAEFVAFAPAVKTYSRGKEIETAPSRLGLARVSVIRGEGSKCEVACIDDYIRATEPVTDYLTQFSGLQPGDLDPSMSRHHLVTMKAAYLKLRYLVDTGCTFVGHGLKKDFRMINLVVPPSQVIDTVDLFYLKRQRKLSLRFLAAYLLKSNIQRVTHDSIEDARTALQLYQLYCKLEEEGRVREVISEMYLFGKKNGWDPTSLSSQALGLTK